MSSTLLEQTRAAHEELERLERLVVKDLQQDLKTHRERLFQSHRVKNVVEEMLMETSKLVDIYEDKDNVRKDEISALGGQRASGQNVFSAFYDRLKEIRDYHRRHPNARVVERQDNMEDFLHEEPEVEFSGEENFGKYVDMHELYNKYINAKFGQPMEYSAYIMEFTQTHKIPRHFKFSKQYQDYLQELLQYLRSFFERTQPLQETDKLLQKVESEFEESWEGGKVHGWEDKGAGKHEAQSDVEDVIVDVDDYDNAQQLVEEVPAEALKEALAALGLKTGGTPLQRAERLMLTKDTPLEEIEVKHFAKGRAPPKKKSPEEMEQHVATCKGIALDEVKVQRFCDLLKEPITETRDYVEKKQARTYEELEAERDEVEEEAQSESDDDEQQIYNPLKLPMGWDGKPIPYWLYKLHGLGQEFQCEICGNYSYWGRRAFERHFKEWRHQHGMRCLGIPNTKNFNEITIIKDAQLLWENIQERQGVVKWKPELEEEYEDKEGNVYNRKTYTDLQRQGLI
eukprot:TRINITY_DN4114_c0_g1_i1.p1 TRINITY_DN4114_c0_g1~~TRINITY_DN4114_c0_g1_i1.p1  ORF type:complete len:513 (-),score=146.40 TRINITY_DN4114_c0_g1_i1:146-1684(-)